MSLKRRKIPLAVRLCGISLLYLGISLFPTTVHADAEPRVLAAPGAAPQNKVVDKVPQTPVTLRFALADHVSGEELQLPAELLERYHGETVLATYQVCIRSDGVVLYVHRRSGIADVDAIITSTLRTWRYPPQPPNTLTCVHEVFEFSP